MLRSNYTPHRTPNRSAFHRRKQAIMLHIFPLNVRLGKKNSSSTETEHQRFLYARIATTPYLARERLPLHSATDREHSNTNVCMYWCSPFSCGAHHLSHFSNRIIRRPGRKLAPSLNSVMEWLSSISFVFDGKWVCLAYASMWSIVWHFFLYGKAC